MKSALRWIVLIVVLSAFGLAGGRPGTGGFVLSALMLAVGVLSGTVLIMVSAARRR
jgi:hypothetical protein